MGMISEFTMEVILNIVADMEPAFEDLISGLPQDVLQSGISPIDQNAVGCEGTGNSTAQANSEEELNLDCYAYVAVSPFAQNEIESINLVVERGISFGGKLNLFNVYEVTAEAKVRKRGELTAHYSVFVLGH